MGRRPIRARGAWAIVALLCGCGPIDDAEHGSATSALTGDPVPVYPANAPDFFVLADGTDLRQYDHRGLLQRRAGLGSPFDAKARSLYDRTRDRADVQWLIRDLDEHRALSKQSRNSNESIYGGSVIKAITAAALLDARDGALSADEWALLIAMIIKSDNTVWDEVEQRAGGWEAVKAFTAKRGYPALRGDHWRAHGGNWVNAADLARFLGDVNHQRFPGAEALFKLMSACDTGRSRAQKYLPQTMHVGGKTGSYSAAPGPVNHQMAFVEHEGRRYGVIALTTNNYDPAPVAALIGGLVWDHILGDKADHAGIGQPSAGGCRLAAGSGLPADRTPLLVASALLLLVAWSRRRR